MKTSRSIERSTVLGVGLGFGGVVGFLVSGWRKKKKKWMEEEEEEEEEGQDPSFGSFG